MEVWPEISFEWRLEEDNGGITASTMFEMYPLCKICANRTDNCKGVVHKRTVVHLSELVLGLR